MKHNPRALARAALIGALYAVLTHLQNILVPGSATWAIQLRLSEALCVLAFFTPAASWGLAIGCFIFNLTFAAALPLDFAVGTAATFIACRLMWRLRRVRLFGIPVAGLAMPALTNAVLVGWELTVYIGGGFPLNALYVALGELAVLFTLGTGLYLVLKRRHLDRRLFQQELVNQQK